MAPGVNGGGRQTGTVPKTKSHNGTSRDYAGRREQGLNHIPNNLVPLEWQSASDPRQPRTRKTSNTQCTSFDYYDTGTSAPIAPEDAALHDNRVLLSHFAQTDDQQLLWGTMNRNSQEMNGCNESTTSNSSRRSRTPRNVLPEKENKSNNITKMPDRNQVVSRLNEIRDYIKQTSSLMDTLKNSGDPRHLAHYQKLSKMVADLRDSEARLEALLSPLPGLEAKMQDVKLSAENTSENGAALPGQPMANTYNSHGNTRGARRQRGVSEGSSTTRSLSEEPTGAVLKSSDSSRRNELKMKVEESQRKLQALQDHQAALVSLQQKAQNQLKEAKVAQGMLLARAGLQPSTSPSLLDQHAGSSNVQSNGVDGNPCILGNMQALEDRLHTLHEIYENRNQLVQILGERDEELTSDHMVLQDKLQELQSKKQHMDHLVAEFQSLNNIPSVSPGLQGDASSSKNDSDEGEASDDDSDYKLVQRKIAELNMMKAQLAQLKGRVSTVENGAARNGIDGVVGALEEAELEQEEQAVNLRRQKKEKGKSGEMKPVVRSNSNTSAGDSNKPDNISQASSEIERIRDIQNKTIQLQEAKARLQHLTDLLATVSGYHNQGQPIPSQYIEILNQEAGDGDAGRASSQPPTGSRSDRQSMEREQCRQSQENSVEGLPEGEITMEQVQAITQDLRHQTRCLNEEREKLLQARLKLGTLARDIPMREKKTNTQVDAQTQQLLLQAELQAKRRELEELMRKDQGQTSSINQDICSEVSVKSETQGYSYLAEGTTTNATWGGSTQGTLDDLGEQDNDVQEQSAGYSSDDGQDDEDEEERTYTTSPSQQLRLAQLNNNKDTLSQSVATSRDLLSMSLDSGRVSLSGNINSSRSNATSIADSTGPAIQPASSHLSRRGPASHNVWRKGSTDSGAAPPRAVWMRPSQGRQENASTAEDLVTSSTTTTEAPPSHGPSACNWWQQQAVQLQHQLELTNNLCQNMLIEQAQQHHMNNSNLLAGAAPASLAPFWGFPLPTYPLAQHPHPVSAPGGSLVPANMAAMSDVYYQQLLAASQMQQQQMMLTTMNQCCHLLWLQQKEMAALRTAIGALQEKTSQGNNEGGESYSPPVMIGQPEETVFISSTQNSAHPTPRQSLSNLSRLQQSGANLSTPVNPHQNLKISYSGGLFQSPEDMTGSSGVTSAHSLPNLSQATVATGSVFSSHQPEVSSSSASNPSHNAGTLLNNMATHGFHPGILPMPFPINNNINFNNRSQQQPLSSFIQPGSGAPWLQQGPHGGHTNPSPVPALNNQVPPGNRANNYWDNFRSYSRQNLLSTSTKSNEGVSHSPSPLVDRSHNTLRGSASLSAPVTQSVSSALHGVAPLFSGPEHNPTSCSMSSRKEKLNTEQYHNSQDNFSIPGSSHNIMTPDGTALRYHIGDTAVSSSSRPGSRQHNCSEFHLQTNASRGHSQHHNVSPLRSMRDSSLVHHHGDRQAPSEHHNLSAMPDYCLESNITVEISPLGSTSHHNFTSPDSIITYEQFSDHLHTPKMQDDTAGSCKRKAAKSVAVGEAKGQTQATAASSSNGKKQQVTNSLFEALSESVYAEVATLISANQNRPHFLIQLFRDLQMINSDPLRQRTLQSIHEVVSRYLANCHQTENNLNSAYGENQQPDQNENPAVTGDLIANGSAASSDEELGKDEGNNYHVGESFGTSLVGQCTESHMQSLATVEEAQTIAENEEGAAALPSSSSSPHALPRNAAWSIKDGLTLTTELPGRGSKLEWEVQGVVVDLLPFLRDHLGETCTPALLETVRTLTLQLVPTENLSIVPPSKATSSSSSVHHSQLGCCYQGQLDALLEDALLKFQGCRLRDVSEELLNAVADVLLSELTFLRLVDTVSRGDNNENNEENPPIRDCSVEEHTHADDIEASRFMNPESNETNYHGSQEVNLGTEAYNGDLAEADQSRHEDTGADVEAESAGALGLDIPTGSHVEAQGSPAEGTACILHESNGATQIVERDYVQADGNCNIILDIAAGEYKSEVEEEWEVEQDREQGLDRVPTRLSTDQQRATTCSGNSTPERDLHGPIPHSDAPIP